MGPHLSTIQNNENKLSKSIQSLRENTGIGGSGNKAHETVMKHLHSTINDNHQNTQKVLIGYYIVTMAVVLIILAMGFILVKFYKKLKRFEDAVSNLQQNAEQNP